MRVFTEEFEIQTKGELDEVDLTAKVDLAVKRSNIREGIALIYAGHTTGGIILNEDEPDLVDDLKRFLRQTFPSERNYHHRENGYAHLRSMLMTPSRVVPIHDGRLGLGIWQSLYWIEADGTGRRRRIEVTVIGE